MTLNPNTRVAVCGYAGDAKQVTSAMRMYTHHECPVTILSPDDAPIEIPGVDCRFGGKRQYVGQLSLDRQREHLRILMTYPEDYFLINDSDSMCLSPKIPEYLYDEPDFLWSNLIIDNIKGREHGYYPDGFPRLAFQPPYFLSKKGIATLLACVEDDNIEANPKLPFIDHYMVQLAVRANLPWRNFRDGISCPISSDKNSARVTWDTVRRRGTIMIHSVKAPKFWEPLAEAHAKYLTEPRGLDDNPFPLPDEHVALHPRIPGMMSPQQRAAMMLASAQRRGFISHQQSKGLKA